MSTPSVLSSLAAIMLTSVASEAYHDWSGDAVGARLCVSFTLIIAESELLQPALNEIHKFCLQHWSRSRGTCGTGSGAPEHCGIVDWCTYWVLGIQRTKLDYVVKWLQILDKWNLSLWYLLLLSKEVQCMYVREWWWHIKVLVVAIVINI